MEPTDFGLRIAECGMRNAECGRRIAVARLRDAVANDRQKPEPLRGCCWCSRDQPKSEKSATRRIADCGFGSRKTATKGRNPSRCEGVAGDPKTSRNLRSRHEALRIADFRSRKTATAGRNPSRCEGVAGDPETSGNLRSRRDDALRFTLMRKSNLRKRLVYFNLEK